jgi:hypothetical protein
MSVFSMVGLSKLQRDAAALPLSAWRRLARGVTFAAGFALVCTAPTGPAAAAASKD